MTESLFRCRWRNCCVPLFLVSCSNVRLMRLSCSTSYSALFASSSVCISFGSLEQICCRASAVHVNYFSHIGQARSRWPTSPSVCLGLPWPEAPVVFFVWCSVTVSRCALSGRGGLAEDVFQSHSINWFASSLLSVLVVGGGWWRWLGHTRRRG